MKMHQEFKTQVLALMAHNTYDVNNTPETKYYAEISKTNMVEIFERETHAFIEARDCKDFDAVTAYLETFCILQKTK
jgi:hypothetical protein